MFVKRRCSEVDFAYDEPSAIMKHVDRSLAPGFLIASPPLGDPNFAKTVVLLAVHGKEGALGFIVNRVAPVSLGEVFKFAGYRGDESQDKSAVYLGGPVSPSTGWILCVDSDIDPEEEGVLAIDERLRVTSRRAAFDAFAQDRMKRPGQSDPKRRMVILGYSGWGPGQLEREIGAGAWLPTPLDEGVMFDVDAEKRWERAYALLGLTPAVMMTMRGGGAA
jgi:putative transcriptional regulator